MTSHLFIFPTKQQQKILKLFKSICFVEFMTEMVNPKVQRVSQRSKGNKQNNQGEELPVKIKKGAKRKLSEEFEPVQPLSSQLPTGKQIKTKR